MNFYNVNFKRNGSIAPATVTIFAPGKAEAIMRASKVYRDENGLPSSFDTTRIFNGCEVEVCDIGSSMP
jgi:hypothetical protein